MKRLVWAILDDASQVVIIGDRAMLFPYPLRERAEQECLRLNLDLDDALSVYHVQGLKWDFEEKGLPDLIDQQLPPLDELDWFAKGRPSRKPRCYQVRPSERIMDELRDKDRLSSVPTNILPAEQPGPARRSDEYQPRTAEHSCSAHQADPEWTDPALRRGLHG